jgi:hypothetical protein
VAEGVVHIPGSAAALPTLSKLKALVYGPIRDSSHEFVEEWFVTDMLNEAYLDLNARLRLNKKVATGTTSTTGTIALPTDLVEHQNLFFNGTPALFTSDDTFLSFERPDVTPYGQGSAVAVLARVNTFDSVVETYPEQASVDYEWEYVARPTVMTAESDTPTKLTQELIPRIINYARAHCYWQDGKEAEGARTMALYEQGLPGAPREAFRRNPGPMALIPEAGPFG